MTLIPLVVILALGAAGPVSSLAPRRPAADRETVVIGTREEPDVLNPVFARKAVSSIVLNTLFTRDVGRDASWRARAEGVESLPTPAAGTWRFEGPGMVLSWKLRRRTWHDGKTVTCADYVFTYRALKGLSRELLPLGGLPLARVGSVVCPHGAGGLDVRVVWKERYAYANLSILPLPWRMRWPQHVLGPVLSGSGGGSRLATVPYGNEPAGTIGDGPYRLTEWRKGESLTVESVGSHPIYGTPRVRRIIWRLFPDPRTLHQSLLAGSIDVASSIQGLSIEQAFELERRAQPSLRVIFVPGFSWEHIDFNLDNPLLKDVRVRRAIAHGVNRTEIVQQLFRGRWSVAHSYLPPGHPGYGGVPTYAYDPPRAKALLRDAGFAPGSDGILVNGRGERLVLDLSTTAGNALREQVQRIVQEQLRRIGIQVDLVNFPARTFFAAVMQRRSYTAMGMYTWIMNTESDCDILYTSDGIPADGTGWRGANYPGYREPEMDRVCKAIGAEVDEARRRALLQESLRIFARDLPALPLFFAGVAAAFHPALRNFSPSPLDGEYDTWNAHEWYWE